MILRAYAVLSASIEATCSACKRVYPHSVPSLTGTCPHCRHIQALTDAAATPDQKQKLVRYAKSVDGCTDLLWYPEAGDPRTPNEERPTWRRLIADLRAGDQVVVLILSETWARHVQIVRAFLDVLRCRASIRVLDAQMLVCHGATEHRLLEVLDQIDPRVTDEAAATRKHKTRRSGRVTNQYAGYGWRVAKDYDGRTYRVPDEKQRALMRQILNRRADGYTWPEIQQEITRQGYKSPHRKAYTVRTLIRMWHAARELFPGEVAAT